jgi:hypothetical protein
MKYLKTYKIFESSQDYGIYDWIEDLKRHDWSHPQNQTVNESSLKKWSDHFIGEGWYDKVINLVDKMFQSIDKADVNYINDRMFDVYDIIPSGKEKYTMCCIAYGDVENWDKPNNRKYNGLLSVRETDNKTKLRIIIHILKEIVFPTLSIGSYPSYLLRQSDESYYVTDKKWQCQNFNIDDYKEMGIEVGATFKGDEKRDVTIHERDITKKKEYSISKILDMYKPCVTVNIGGYSDSHTTGKMNLLKLESDLDEVLPSILPTLDYEEVIFDVSRGNRGFDTENYEVYDYTVKILLNF